MLFLLQHLEKAVAQAEKAGLPPMAVGLQEAFVDVAAKDDGKAPPDEELAQRPVDSWPGFKLRIRGHVSPLLFTQPARFRRETLLEKPGRSIADRPTGAKPEAADYAATAVALFGGETTRPFVITLLVGIASGTYSSIFNAAALLVVWEKREWRTWFGRGDRAAAAA